MTILYEKKIFELKSRGRAIEPDFKYKLMLTAPSPGQLYCLTSLVLKMYITYVYSIYYYVTMLI